MLLQPLRAYADNRDPLAAAGNRVALLVAVNQPFYPIYVAWLVGNAWPTLLTFLSTPLFLAVPAVARRSPQAGRALLVLAGVANTMLAAKAVGVASGVEAFLAPCVVLAGLLFRPGERRDCARAARRLLRGVLRTSRSIRRATPRLHGCAIRRIRPVERRQRRRPARFHRADIFQPSGGFGPSIVKPACQLRRIADAIT